MSREIILKNFDDDIGDNLSSIWDIETSQAIAQFTSVKRELVFMARQIIESERMSDVDKQDIVAALRESHRLLDQYVVTVK